MGTKERFKSFPFSNRLKVTFDWLWSDKQSSNHNNFTLYLGNYFGYFCFWFLYILISFKRKTGWKKKWNKNCLNDIFNKESMSLKKELSLQSFSTGVTLFTTTFWMLLIFLKLGFTSMQGWTATTARHEVTRKNKHKKIKSIQEISLEKTSS